MPESFSSVRDPPLRRGLVKNNGDDDNEGALKRELRTPAEAGTTNAPSPSQILAHVLVAGDLAADLGRQNSLLDISRVPIAE